MVQLQPILYELVNGISLTGEIARDILIFFNHHNLPMIANHSEKVASRARNLAIQFDEDPNKADLAGFSMM